MSRVLIAILIMVTAACGHSPAINQDLKASVDRYLAHSPNDGHLGELISVDWGEVSGTELGVCLVKPELSGGHTRKIRILHRHYATELLDALVAHELAHCLHDKKHDDSRTPALMNSGLDEDIGFWRENLDSEIERIFR